MRRGSPNHRRNPRQRVIEPRRGVKDVAGGVSPRKRASLRRQAPAGRHIQPFARNLSATAGRFSRLVGSRVRSPAEGAADPETRALQRPSARGVSARLPGRRVPGAPSLRSVNPGYILPGPSGLDTELSRIEPDHRENPRSRWKTSPRDRARNKLRALRLVYALSDHSTLWGNAPLRHGDM